MASDAQLEIDEKTFVLGTLSTGQPCLWAEWVS